MAKGVEIKSMDDAPEMSFPALSGVQALGNIRTKSLIANKEALFLWIHELPAGATIQCKSPKYDHLLYIWHGSVNVDSVGASDGQVVVFEHGSSGLLEAGDAGATIAHFHQSESQPLLTDRAGGHVHVVDKKGLFSNRDEGRHATNTVWADAHCPTCEMWLHRSAFDKARPQSEPHMHNEDEIIFVIDGATQVGKMHPPGTAIAVAAGTIYAFGIADGGTTFINFRATNPLVKMTTGGKGVGDWISERAFMKNEAQVPVIDARAMT